MKYVIPIAAVVLLAGLAFLFFRSEKQKREINMQLIDAQKRSIEILESSVAILSDQKEYLEQDRNEHERKDSLLQIAIEQNRINYNAINRRYAQIQNDIDRIANNDDSIRAAYSWRPAD